MATTFISFSHMRRVPSPVNGLGKKTKKRVEEQIQIIREGYSHSTCLSPPVFAFHIHKTSPPIGLELFSCGPPQCLHIFRVLLCPLYLCGPHWDILDLYHNSPHELELVL